MGTTRRIFTKEFKLAAIKEVESGKPTTYVARRLEIDRHTLNRWRREYRKHSGEAFSGQGRRVVVESREAELERKIGQQAMEIDFLKKVLAALKEEQESVEVRGGYTRRSGKKGKR